MHRTDRSPEWTLAGNRLVTDYVPPAEREFVEEVEAALLSAKIASHDPSDKFGFSKAVAS